MEWVSLQDALTNTKEIIEKTDFTQLYQRFIDNPLNQKSEEYCKAMLSHIGVNKKPDAYNIGVNKGEAAGRTIDHLHQKVPIKSSGL